MREPVYNVINDHDFKHGTYIIITDKLNLTEYDYGKLTYFLKQGNDVFIAASDFGSYVEKKLNIATDRQYADKNPTSIRFVNQHLDSAKTYTFSKHIGEEYFSEIDTDKAVILGKNSNNRIAYIKYNFGSGALYLHTNPLLFSNYSMLQTQGAEYVANALSYVKDDHNLIWDEFYTQGRDGEESLLRVFLRNSALQWSYYISFFSLIIFVVYEAKRRQRIIPVIDPLSNSTLDFVNVVGQVYYEQRNNSNIAQKQATYFLEHIRNKYYLKTSLLNEELVESLSQKTGIEPDFLKQIFNQVTIIRSGINISDNDLISFNKNVEQFYIQSR